MRMRVKTLDEILVSCSIRVIYKNHSGIFRIDPHAAFKVSAEDKNSYLNPSLRGDQPYFGWTTWQSHLLESVSREK
ncbi:MAG TPA: hypothetical protein DCY12_07000 [Candidatus Atribacteria bacterium]|nr:hypothetical protein [Candidatus Atribacteria bacterium]